MKDVRECVSPQYEFGAPAVTLYLDKDFRLSFVWVHGACLVALEKS